MGDDPPAPLISLRCASDDADTPVTLFRLLSQSMRPPDSMMDVSTCGQYMGSLDMGSLDGSLDMGSLDGSLDMGSLDMGSLDMGSLDSIALTMDGLYPSCARSCIGVEGGGDMDCARRAGGRRSGRSGWSGWSRSPGGGGCPGLRRVSGPFHRDSDRDRLGPPRASLRVR